MSKKGINLDKKNGMWKGNQVGYEALHIWIKARLPKPKRCQKCNKKKKLELCNKSGKYKRILSDWIYMCRSCNMDTDDRKKNLLKGHLGRKLKSCQICGDMTKGIKYCKKCSKEQRRLWWKKYNQKPKRKKYRRLWWQKNYQK